MTLRPTTPVPTPKTADVLRRAHVHGERLTLAFDRDAVLLKARREEREPALDILNGLADVDAGATLPWLAKRLQRQGLVFPIARPLPPLTLQAAAAACPFLVDAFVASAEGIATDGGAFTTPRAPRAAAGPDLLGAVTTSPPAAVLLRARIRVYSASRGAPRRERYASIDDAAARVGALLDEGRAEAFDAFGTDVLVLAAAGSPRRLVHGAQAVLVEDAALFAHAHEAAALVDDARRRAAGVRGASDRGPLHAATFWTTTSLVPGDAAAIRGALAAGHRVAGAPLVGRAAILTLDRRPVRIVDAATAAAKLAQALVDGAVRHDGARRGPSGRLNG